MDGEAFLKYLINSDKISENEAKTCLNESSTQDTSVAETLIHKEHVTIKTLKICLNDFHRKQKMNLAQVTNTPSSNEEIDILNDMKKVTRLIRLNTDASQTQDIEILDEVEQLTEEAEKHLK